MFTPSSSASLKSIRLDLQTFIELLPHYNLRSAAVSGWSVGQQMEHTTKATRLALKLIQSDQDPPDGVEPAGLLAALVLLIGRFPKGRKAPEGVMPKGINEKENREYIEQIVKMIDEIAPNTDILDRDTRKYLHPRLNGLTKREWLRFVAVHQRHHLRIINRIIAAAVPPAA